MADTGQTLQMAFFFIPSTRSLNTYFSFYQLFIPAECVCEYVCACACACVRVYLTLPI